MLFFNARSVLERQPPLGELPADKVLFTDTLKTAWPAMLESFLAALITFADTVMVGALGSYAIAAVGLTAQPRFLCLSIFLSMNIAVAALVARRKGAEKRSEANQVLIQALCLTAVFSLLISAPALIFADSVLRFAGSRDDTHVQAVMYFRIIVGSLIVQTLTLVINAAQRGAGNTKTAMKNNLVSNALNILCNYLLIEGRFGFPALGVKGAAIASVIGFSAGLVLALASVLKPDSYLFLFYRSNTLRFRSGILSSLHKVASGAFIEQVFLRIGFFLYAVAVANLGTSAFAAHQIGMNIIGISFAVGDGLGVAGISLVGQNLGRGRSDIAKIYGIFCQRIGLLCALCIAAFYAASGSAVYRLFSSEPLILEYGSLIMKIIALIVILQVAQVICGGCLRGAGDTRYTALVSLISVAIIRPLSAWLFVYPLGFGLIGAWLGLTLDQFMRFILTWTRFKSGKWQSIEL
ncbi:MATE family efflux transporter [Treponema sp. HNW]|uniref:MATE family efflux transporter n=1 Tax=Treponema sp. HNW TaxID=3116654 RepID=UPI003D0D7367